MATFPMNSDADSAGRWFMPLCLKHVTNNIDKNWSSMGSASSTSGRTDFGISAPACRFGRWGPAGLLARTGLFRRIFLCVSRGVRDVGAQQPVFSFVQEG